MFPASQIRSEVNNADSPGVTIVQVFQPIKNFFENFFLFCSKLLAKASM